MTRRALAVVAVVALSGCGDDQGTEGETSAANSTGSLSSGDMSTTTQSDPSSSGVVDGSSSTGAPAWPERVAVTADWLAGTLTVLDLDALATGATARADVEVVRIDLSAFTPGPLQLELISADEALVAISPGFYDGIVGNTIGVGDVPLGGTLLRVDLRSGEVLAEYTTAHVPMGLAISADRTRAYSANYGHSEAPGDTLSVMDLTTDTVLADIVVGARPEQVSLSNDGALGIVNLAGDGAVRVFETADVEGTLSTPVETSADPSDVDFIAGTSLAVVANSLAPAAYSVLDVSAPALPVVVHEAEPPGGFPYGLTPVPATTDFVMTIASEGVKFTRVDAASEPPVERWLVELPEVTGFPLGVAIDVQTGLALCGAPGANVLVVLDLEDGSSRTLDWGGTAGPTYVAVGP